MASENISPHGYSGPRRRQLQPWTILVPLLLTLALQLPWVASAGWVADDAINLAQHAHDGDVLGEWTHPTYAWAGGSQGHIWRPIPASLQHMAALLIGRTGPVFRSLNLLLHLTNLLLLQVLVRRLGAGRGTAAILATCWALHPATTEAVCWASDIYDLAMTTCLLMSALAALVPKRGSKALPVLATSLLTLAACLCKETALAWLLVLPGLTWLWRGRRQALLHGLAAALGAAIYAVLHRLVSGEDYAAAMGQSPLLEQLHAWLALTGLLAWVPQRAPMAHIFDPGSLPMPALGLATGMVLLALAAWAPDDRARRSLLGSWWAWCLLLAPAGVAIPMTGIEPLRYAYAPGALALALLGGAIAAVPAGFWRSIGLAALLPWCLLMARRAVTRIQAWQDDGTLWADDLRLEPGNPYALGNLGHFLVGTARAERGLRLWYQAVETAPENLRVFPVLQERYKLAQAAYLHGMPALSLDQVEKMIAQSEQNGMEIPGNAWCLLADSLDALGRHREAVLAEQQCPGLSKKTWTTHGAQ